MIEFSQVTIFLIFFLWGALSFSKSLARERRYRKYQRDWWLLADAWEYGLMSLALFGSAMRNGNHPYIFFETEEFRQLIILAWLLALIPMAIGQALDWISQSKIEIERSKGWNRDGR